jgi:cell division protein FtsL
MGMTDDMPEMYRLSFLVGEIVRNDTYAEHETRVLWNRLRDAGLGEENRQRDFGRLLPQVRSMLAEDRVPTKFRRLATQVVDDTLHAHQYRSARHADARSVDEGKGAIRTRSVSTSTDGRD